MYWLRYFTDTSLGEQGVVSLTEGWKSLSALKNVMGFIVYLDNVVFTTYVFLLLKVPGNSTGSFELFLGCQVEYFKFSLLSPF